MPLTMQQLIDNVIAKLDSDPTTRAFLLDTIVLGRREEIVSLVVGAAVDGLGFNVAASTGEIVDPRPAPSVRPRDDRGARWSGGRRRR